MKKLLVISFVFFGFVFIYTGSINAAEGYSETSGIDKIESPDSLLKRLRESRMHESIINKKREQEFLSNKKARERMLEEARKELVSNDKRAENLLKQLEQGNKQIDELYDSLNKGAGNLNEIFAVVRQHAGDLSVVLQESLISSQYPDRSSFFDEMSRSRDMPPVEKLNKLWYALLQEMTESGKIIKYNSPVITPEGETEDKMVTRIGVFTAVADGKFLRYSSETGNLIELRRQPSSHHLNLAEDFEQADKGLLPMTIDPTRGNFLELLMQKPELSERIEQGGAVGYIIIVIGILGIVFALYRFYSLSQVGKHVESQLNNIDRPDSANPLGRILAVMKEIGYTDVENLELSLDEAILKEVPHLEKGQTIIKLLAVVAPMLGLLGTVIGMIITFQAITLFGTGDPKLMADGISQALVTTALGLLVAIPLLFSHSMVVSRSKSIVQILDQQSAGIIAGKIEEQKENEKKRKPGKQKKPVNRKRTEKQKVKKSV